LQRVEAHRLQRAAEEIRREPSVRTEPFLLDLPPKPLERGSLFAAGKHASRARSLALLWRPPVLAAHLRALERRFSDERRPLARVKNVAA
jgi:hypothetical protein